MEESMKKEKLDPTETTNTATNQSTPDDQTPPSSPHRHFTQSPSSPPDTAALQQQQQLSSTYMSSKSAEPKLVHSFRSLTVQKRLKLIHPNDFPITQRQETPPSSPRINLSSIPPANRRPFFNPLPQSSHLSFKSATANRSSNSVFSIRQNIVARLRLMKPVDRVEFIRTGRINRSTKHKRHKASKPGPGRILEPSPLGPGPTPYQKVQKSLTELKHFINSLSSNVETAKPEHAPAQPPTDPETVEDVIKMLEGYMKKVPWTIGAQEMEDGLLEIQNKVGADPRPTWYALMCKSYEDMWECLIDYFSCEALDEDIVNGRWC